MVPGMSVVGVQRAVEVWEWEMECGRVVEMGKR